MNSWSELTEPTQAHKVRDIGFPPSVQFCIQSLLLLFSRELENFSCSAHSKSDYVIPLLKSSTASLQLIKTKKGFKSHFWKCENAVERQCISL